MIMPATSSDSDDGHKKRVLPSWMGSKDKGKHSTKKQADNHDDNMKQVKRSGDSADASPSQTSQQNMDFSKLLDGVVFALSGFVNPERATLRTQAIEMGAVYRPDWTPDCTILVCAFTNTPKFRQVKSDGGTIVSKDWIFYSYNQKKLVDIEPYLMHAGKPWRKSVKHLQAGQGHKNNQVEDSPESARRSHAKPTESAMLKGNSSDNLNGKFSSSKIKDWAISDLKETVAWLESQEEKPGKNEIEAIAAEGIITCLQDVIESLGRNQDACNVIEQWNFVPRVVREVMELESKRSEKEVLSKKELADVSLRCKELYEQEYDKIKKLKMKKQKVEEKGSDNAEYDTDETIEMTEEEIDLAFQKFSGM